MAGSTYRWPRARSPSPPVRRRLSNAIVRAERADLTVDAGLDLADGQARREADADGAGRGGRRHASGRPEIGIVLKGPIGGPTRTLDVAVLSSWLALRAVEQQAKRLDALEVAAQQCRRSAGRSGCRSASRATGAAAAPRRHRLQLRRCGGRARSGAANDTPRSGYKPRARPAPAPGQPATPQRWWSPFDIRPKLTPSAQQPSATRGSSILQNSVRP